MSTTKRQQRHRGEDDDHGDHAADRGENTAQFAEAEQPQENDHEGRGCEQQEEVVVTPSGAWAACAAWGAVVCAASWIMTPSSTGRLAGSPLVEEAVESRKVLLLSFFLLQ